MNRVIVLALAALVATATVGHAMSACPESQVSAPAATAMGPYQIIGWGTGAASVAGLPTCEAAMYHAGLMVGAAQELATYAVSLQADGSYVVKLNPVQ